MSLFHMLSLLGHQHASNIDSKTLQRRQQTHHTNHTKIDTQIYRFWCPKWPRNGAQIGPGDDRVMALIFVGAKVVPRVASGDHLDLILGLFWTTWVSFWPPAPRFDTKFAPKSTPKPSTNDKKCNTKHTQKVYSKLLICGFITTDSKRQESKRQLQGGGGGASAARRLRYNTYVYIYIYIYILYLYIYIYI